MVYPSKNPHIEFKRFSRTLNLEDDPQLIEDYGKVHEQRADL